MKRIYTAFAVSFLLGIIVLHFASCEKYILPSVILSKDTLYVGCQAQQDIKVKVSANVMWQLSVTQGEGWLEATPKGKVKGDSTICITVRANTSEEPRQGRINVTSETLSKNLVILQDGDI